jgi:hypothetical protein
MNAFDLNRKEYIRVDNSDGQGLKPFEKVTFLTSFVITGQNDYSFPTGLSLTQNSRIFRTNDRFIKLIAAYCTRKYLSYFGYACYISKMGVLNSDIDINVPYAKVNVYVINGIEL